MPLLVTKSCPSRNALLLFGSSQDSVPGTNVGYSSFAYSSAFIVSGLSMVTLLSLSTSLPPNDQTSHWHHVLPSPVALPKAIPAGVPFSFSALHSLRKPSVSFGNESNPAALTALTRYVMQTPATPSGTPIHFLPSGLRYGSHTGYQPPYFAPR